MLIAAGPRLKLMVRLSGTGRLPHPLRLDDNHWLQGYALPGGHGGDCIAHLLAGNHLAEYGISPAVNGFGLVVQSPVVHQAAVELLSGRMRTIGAGHGSGVAVFLETVVRFIGEGRLGAIFLEVRRQAAALNDKTGHCAVENRAVVEAFTHIFQKIGHAFGPCPY